MSRIVISCHPNGMDKVVIGWDRPMNTYFAHLYDDEGMTEVAVDSMNDNGVMDYDMKDPITTPDELWNKANDHGIVFNLECNNLRDILETHKLLEYPESNIMIDFSDKINPIISVDQ